MEPYHEDSQFYRLDRIILRTVRAAFTVGLLPAYLSWRLNMTYRYDNRRDGIIGRNPGRRRPTASQGSFARAGLAAVRSKAIRVQGAGGLVRLP